MGKLTEIILEWPDDFPLDAQQILNQHPGLQDDSTAVITLAMEEYIDRWERGEKAQASKFAARFPSVESLLLKRLNQIELLGKDTAVTPWPKTGKIFQGFYIDELLGIGSFSRVYLCRQQDLYDRPVVLKVTTDTVQEFEMLARLSHPGITTLHSSHFDPSTGFNACCQKFFSCWTAADLLTQYHCSKSDEITDAWQLDRIDYHKVVISLIIEVADALAYAHDNGVLHNDIKPSNLLVSDDFHAQLIDFNASSRLGDVIADRFIGTLPYLPTEILKAIAKSETVTLKPNRQTDIYALAVCCYEMLTGRLPFEPPAAETGFVESCKHLMRQHDSTIKPVFSHQVTKVLQRALSCNKDERYNSANEFAQDLQRAVQPKTYQKVLLAFRKKKIGTVVKYSAALLLMAALLINLRWRIVSPGVSASLNGVNNSQKAETGYPFLSGQDLFKESLENISENELLKAERALIAESARTASPHSYALLAYVQYKLNKPVSESLVNNQLAVDLGLCNPRILNNLGYLLIRNQRLDEAAAILDRAIESKTTLYQAYYNRAIAELIISKAAGRLPDPKYISRAIELAPDMKKVISSAKATRQIWEQSDQAQFASSFSESEHSRIRNELDSISRKIRNFDRSTSLAKKDLEPIVFPFDDMFLAGELNR